MRNLDIINSEIASLEAQLETAKNALYVVQDNHSTLIREIWTSMLGSILQEGDIVSNSYDNGIRVTRVQVRTERSGKQYNYNQEIYSISRSSYGRTEGVPFQLSTYSTTVDNDFEFDRLITVGKVASFVKNNQDALIEAFTIASPWNTVEQKEVYRISGELQTLNNEKSQIENDNRLAKLETEGLEFMADKWNNLPTLDVRFDWTVRNIFKIKVIKKTASGKSADLEITSRYKTWEGTIQDNITVVDKVRMDKVESLLYSYRDQLVA